MPDNICNHEEIKNPIRWCTSDNFYYVQFPERAYDPDPDAIHTPECPEQNLPPLTYTTIQIGKRVGGNIEDPGTLFSNEHAGPIGQVLSEEVLKSWARNFRKNLRKIRQRLCYEAVDCCANAIKELNRQEAASLHQACRNTGFIKLVNDALDDLNEQTSHN